MEQNNKKNKHKLTLDVSPDKQLSDNRSTNDTTVNLKPIFSAKNANRPSKIFSFNHKDIRRVKNIEKQDTLEQKNRVLYQSLVALKTGAVLAIAEKQEEINQLKSQKKVQEDVKIIEDQLEIIYQECRELRMENNNLQQKIYSQREGYLRMLEEKQRIIEEICSELDSTQLQIQNLQQTQLLKDKKIRIIEEQNYNLFQQLQAQKLSQLGFKQTQLNSQQSIFQKISLEQTLYSSSCSKDFNHSLEHQKIKQIELRHKQQLHQLSLFYEKRLSQIRKLYEQQWSILDNNGKLIVQDVHSQFPISFKETSVSHKKLSHELINLAKLSDCYSITKRNPSKVDSLSVFTAQRQKGQSQCNKSRKIVVTRQQTNQNSEKMHTGSSSRFPENPLRKRSTLIQQNDKKSLKIGFFLAGAATGGAMATVFCKFL